MRRPREDGAERDLKMPTWKTGVMQPPKNAGRHQTLEEARDGFSQNLS